MRSLVSLLALAVVFAYITQRRVSSRWVRMLSNLAVTRGSVAARAGCPDRRCKTRIKPGATCLGQVCPKSGCGQGRTAQREPLAGDRDVLA